MQRATMNGEIYAELKYILKLKPENGMKKLEEFLSHYRPKSLRSSQQNKALHVDCQLIADKLNDAGLYIQKILKQEAQIPWTVNSVKEYIFRPVMKVMFGKDSTTELEKMSGELDDIHEVIMREFGEKYEIEYHEFPHEKQGEI